MTFMDETSNKRIATTALWPTSIPSRPDRVAGELYIPMAGNTGAGENQPCFDLFGPDRICLHFIHGWSPVNLPEGTYVRDL